MSTAWFIASGKGGVGKSTFTANIGLSMAREGRKVCIIDGDIGLRDQDALLGLENRIVFDLLDAAEGSCRLEQAVLSLEDEPRLSLLPASQFARAKELKPGVFRRILIRLKQLYDAVLIDCPAGVERSLRGLMNDAVDECIIICTPDDICIRNAERTASILEKKEMPRPRLIVNRLDEALIRGGEMYSAATVAAALDLELLGEVPDDSFVYRAALTHQPLINIDCEAQRALKRISWRMMGITSEAPLPGYGTVKLPWYRRLFQPTLKEVKRIDR